MATYRVLDTWGMEIHVCQTYYHISPRKRSINTEHTRHLSHITPSVRGQLCHFIITGHKLVPHIQGYFFISDICNHQGTHIQQSATDTVTTLNLIHDFNWPRKHHTTIAAWKTCKKALRKLCDESKYRLRTLLGKWRLDDNKYMSSWQWFLSRYPHTLYYR